MKRPLGFTLLSLLFAWLALAGLMLAWATPLVPPKQLHAIHLSPQVMVVGGLACGASALWACVALWRSSTLASRAVAAWGICSILFMVSFQAMVATAEDPLWLIVLANVLLLTFIAFLYRYVNRKSQFLSQAV
jgi:hypothetical protein